MSIICTSSNGWLISHSEYISKIYENSGSKMSLKQDLFNINVPYIKKENMKYRKKKTTIASLKIKSEEIESIIEKYKKMHIEFNGHFKDTKLSDNCEAFKLSEEIYEKTQTTAENTNGGNAGPCTLQKIHDTSYLFPENCKFFCQNIEDIHQHIPADENFNLILLDPPWWNKYIRRKRKKTTHAYEMMYNEDLKRLNLDQLLQSDGLIAVWCTNSTQHFKDLTEGLFPLWGVKYIAKWYWLKVTKNGEPVCNFSEPPGKQPFEQIVFGSRIEREIPNENILLSVPSALHSHKPPLVELLHDYLPDNPKCLELFARYLLPNWTSYGNEALKFQHESLYELI